MNIIEILKQYDFNDPKSIKEIFQLPENEKNHIISVYDEEAIKLNRYLSKMISRFNAEKRLVSHHYLEIPYLNMLQTKIIGEQSGIYVPTLKESVHLMTLTNYRTAFMMTKPMMTVFFLDFMYKLNNLGKWFILCHEAQHFARFHGVRGKGKNSEIWNIATDAIINYDLMVHKLPHVLKEMDKNRKQLNFVDQDLFPDFELNAIDNNSFIIPKIFDKIARNGLFEEEIYTMLIKKQQSSGGQSKQQQQQQSQQGQGDSSNQGQGCNPTGGNRQGQLSNDNSQDFDNEHIQDGFKAAEKMSQNTHYVDEILNQSAEETANEYQEMIKKFGLPTTQVESSELEQQEEKINQEIARQQKRLQENNHKRGEKHNKDEVGDILKRKQDVLNKYQFLMFVKNAIRQKLSKVGEMERSPHLNSVSRMSKHPIVQESMGLKEPIKLYRKHRKEKRFTMLVIQDVSGSMGIKDFVHYHFNYLRDIILTHPCDIHYTQADTEMFKSKVLINRDNYHEFEQNGFNIFYGGGTDMFMPLCQGLVEGYEEKGKRQDYDLVVILSDGYFPSFSKADFDIQIKKMVQKYNHEHKQDKIKNLFVPTIMILNIHESCFDRNTIASWKGGLMEFILTDNENKREQVEIQAKHNNKKRNLLTMGVR